MATNLGLVRPPEMPGSAASVLSNVGNIRMPAPQQDNGPLPGFDAEGNFTGFPDKSAATGVSGDVNIKVADLTQGVTTSDGTTFTEMPDGAIFLGGNKPATNTDDSFDANLADSTDTNSLGSLAVDLLDGINADIQSRQSWVATYSKGMDLLGLKIEQPSNVRNRKRNSTVVHPLLCEAVVQFQSAARSELLPSDGPAKIRNDAEETDDSDALATAFEKDFNHFLTVTATEYYPDTDRMLFYLGYGGTTYKKVYRCPVRNRPVSEAVYLPDLIVSNDATDLENAPRITHQIQMTRSQVRRLQLSGFYRDITLMPPSPLPAAADQVNQKERELQGRTPNTMRPQDLPRTIYECYCEIVPAEYGLTEKGAPDDLPLPYRVSIDLATQAVLEVRRNWKSDDPMYMRRKRFVKFEMVPGFGFLGLGFLHLLGNSTRALTAAWRILIDAGMYANFPGGLRMKGTRQSTNEFTPGPGEFPEIDTGPATDIRQAVMPLPYKDPSAVFIQFADNIADRASRLGGAVELEVGEGRTNAPVGTVMAMIEQQTQVAAAVHKRLWTSQGEELQLLRELFKEDPEALWRYARSAARKWKAAAEFADMDLVPATDPNVPGQAHRLMVASALVMLAQTPLGQAEMDGRATLKRAVTAMGVSSNDDLFKPVSTPPQGGGDGTGGPNGAGPLDPALAAIANKQADTERAKAIAGAIAAEKKHAIEGARVQSSAAESAADRASREKIAGEQEETKRMGILADLKTAGQDASLQAAEMLSDAASAGVATVGGSPVQPNNQSGDAPASQET